MTPPAITVCGLSKRYRIGARRRERTFREALTDAALSPVRRLRSFGRASHRDEDSIWALKDVSFEVQPGEVLGVIGANGAGKSTLLKILSRITDPTEGTAELAGRVGSLLEVGTGFHHELTGRENIYLSGAILGMAKAETAARFDEIVAFSGIEPFIDTPVKRYSSGMRVRLGFAVAAHLEPEILLIDEVLAVGDAAFRKKCLGKMEEVSHGGRTVLFVSHNMAAVSHLCTKCLALAGGRVLASGDVDETVARYLATAEPGEGVEGRRFALAPPAGAVPAHLSAVELLDEQGGPAGRVETGGPLRVRMHFRCAQAGRYALTLHLRTPDGVPLMAFGTESTDGFHLDCAPGEHWADVVVPRLPLAAGTYVVGAGISIPRVRWLHRVERAGTLEVASADVFGAGRAVTSKLCLVVAEHDWELPDGDEGVKRVP